ncbi:RNA polymerase sigma-54 factor [Niastella koreensis]|uniref:RNA polymerase, sigma 54 subunit, RpoN/SigL n=2 Tax=Niastella koreensis TaxID=354356 RepID=G8TNY0_NIAKG|nr:RNA polymerase factor sigma-54 [Niastella koreensis]AEW02065.1 RNA polymerase, sigma 54 subunit, RpoN/SigL [Niastella koreensis GR20-10]OQP48755.1 RNA polymerase sigma-54 factor [Niastella koreensis]
MLQQNLVQKQETKILPQQIQLLNLFHLNTLELEHRIEQELEDNPFLEKKEDEDDPKGEKSTKEQVQDFEDWDEHGYDDIPDYKMEYSNYLPDEEKTFSPMKAATDFREDLKKQYRLCCNDANETLLADYLIDCLSDNGLLEIPLDKVAEEYSFANKTWLEGEDFEKILKNVQKLDPLGIGARSICECLLLQLKAMNGKRPDVQKAICLLQDHYQDLRNRNMDKIMECLQLEEDELKIILELVSSLKMKPVAEVQEGSTPNAHIIPDFLIVQEGDYLEVSLYNQRSSSLFISREWKEIVADSQKGKKDAAAAQYLKNKYQSAQWFVSAIRQREGTMLRIMKAIVNMQYEYFREGDIKLLKPMILKNIADKTGVDISTVSRITCNKYVDTPFGMILLKDLFTEGIINEKGEAISNRVIQVAIEDAIEKEDKKNPYTDQQLVAILAQKGFSIARRTVAKYREILQIPVAQMRSIWA